MQDDFDLYIKALYDEFTYQIIMEAVDLLYMINPDFEDTWIKIFLSQTEQRDNFGNKNLLENYLIGRLIDKIQDFYVYVNTDDLGFDSLKPLTEILETLNTLDEYEDPELLFVAFSESVSNEETLAEIINETHPLTSVEEFMNLIDEVSITFIKNQIKYQKERMVFINRNEEVPEPPVEIIEKRNKVRNLLEKYECHLMREYFESGGDVGRPLQHYIDELFVKILSIGTTPEAIESIAEHLVVMECMSNVDRKNFSLAIIPLIPKFDPESIGISLSISKALLIKREESGI